MGQNHAYSVVRRINRVEVGLIDDLEGGVVIPKLNFTYTTTIKHHHHGRIVTVLPLPAKAAVHDHSNVSSIKNGRQNGALGSGTRSTDI